MSSCFSAQRERTKLINSTDCAFPRTCRESRWRSGCFLSNTTVLLQKKQWVFHWKSGWCERNILCRSGGPSFLSAGTLEQATRVDVFSSIFSVNTYWSRTFFKMCFQSGIVASYGELQQILHSFWHSDRPIFLWKFFAADDTFFWVQYQFCHHHTRYTGTRCLLLSFPNTIRQNIKITICTFLNQSLYW